MCAEGRECPLRAPGERSAVTFARITHTAGGHALNLWQLITRLFWDEGRIQRLEQNMVTKEEFDAAQSAYFAKVKALIAKLSAHPAAADFTEELAALNTAQADLPADDATQAASAA